MTNKIRKLEHELPQYFRRQIANRVNFYDKYQVYQLLLLKEGGLLNTDTVLLLMRLILEKRANILVCYASPISFYMKMRNLFIASLLVIKSNA